QRRGAQDSAEAVAAGETEMDRCRCGVEDQLEQQPFLVTPVANLPHPDHASIGVGQKRIVDAPLREEILLHLDGEEVLERAAARSHHVAEPDQRVAARGSSVADHLLLQCIEYRFRVEAATPTAAAPEEF